MERIRTDQVDAASRTLAVAFHDGPLLQALAADEAKRAAIAPWFMGVSVRYGLPFGQVWADEDAGAVAVWIPPRGTPLSTVGLLRAGMARLPFKAGVRCVPRIARLMSATQSFHEAVHGPHWYLMTLGTRPELQGRGHGSRLVEAGTSQADAAGLPCYLETATDGNVAFYLKRGFEVIGEATVDGLTLRGMVRPAARG